MHLNLISTRYSTITAHGNHFCFLKKFWSQSPFSEDCTLLTLKEAFGVCLCVYVYIYICKHTYIHINVYIHV